MIRRADEDFRRKLDEFNASQGGPARIDVAWHPKKERWQVFAVPQDHTHHPLARNDITIKLVRPFPDSSGREGVLLFTLRAEDGGFMPLDDRLFTTLYWADSFRSRHHFDETIKNPEIQKELAMKKDLRERVSGATDYWYGIDRVVKSMNPDIKQPGDWRATRWWR